MTDQTFFPDSFGVKTYSHTFTGLTPFTAYEAWVAPYNQTGVGTSAGVGFTTPAEVDVEARPLSGKSVLLRWLAPTIGGYQVQRSSAGTFSNLGDEIRTTNATEQRVIVENMNAVQTLRVAWQLAFLRSQSAPVTGTPLPAGTPEFVSVHGSPTFIPPTRPRVDGNRVLPGAPARMGTRQTVTYRTTVAGAATYILQRQTVSGWQTVEFDWAAAARAGWLCQQQLSYIARCDIGRLHRLPRLQGSTSYASRSSDVVQREFLLRQRRDPARLLTGTNSEGRVTTHDC